MKIICTADTHGLHERLKLPSADVLIVAGDICPMGRMEDVRAFGQWLGNLPHSHKVVIAGNHDKPFQVNPTEAISALIGNDPTIHYLQDSAITIDGIKFYGSPWTPTFMNWYFMADKGEEIQQMWNKIPTDTDVLITHGPPAGILDNVKGTPEGCIDLLKRVSEVNPKYHIFGHIHEGYGMRQREEVTYVNASLCDARYRPINAPIEIEL